MGLYAKGVLECGAVIPRLLSLYHKGVLECRALVIIRLIALITRLKPTARRCRRRASERARTRARENERKRDRPRKSASGGHCV